ncbi:MAG: hypothetical protein GXP43_02060 [bacterium]|nr:hypothetical protein [bacterium]
MIKIKTRHIIIVLALIAAATSLGWWLINRPPKITQHLPTQSGRFFSSVEVSLSKSTPLQDMALEITPPLSTLPPQKTSPTSIKWLLQSLPQPNTAYTITVKHKGRKIFSWQITTPKQPAGSASYPADINRQVQNYLNQTPLLQSLPKPNPFFLVKYHSEKHITIYPFHPDQKLAKQKAKKWLNSLPPQITQNLQVDWAR